MMMSQKEIMKKIEVRERKLAQLNKKEITADYTEEDRDYDITYVEDSLRVLRMLVEEDKEEEIEEEFKTQLKAARKAAGMTQREMAVEMEIPLRTIEDWETGKRLPPSYVGKMVLEKLQSI